MKLREKTNIEICEENGLSTTYMLNVAEESTTKNKIRATMQIISKILCGTLGPYGSTTIIQDRERHHLPTKDGYDLMNKVVCDDEVARTILDILRNISGSQVTAVGDGSTSAVVVAAELYNTITDKKYKKFFQAVAPKDIVDILNKLEAILEAKIKMSARPLSPSMIELDRVAAIATNNDKATGQMVADIYRKVGRYGFVTTDIIDSGEKDKVEYREGISWRRGYADDCFVYGKATKKVDHENPYIFLTTKYFMQSDLQLLADIIGKAASDRRELLIVCNGIDEDVRTFVKKNRTKHLDVTKNTPELVFTVVDIDNVTNTGKATLKDLAILTGCEIYDPELNRVHNEPYLLANMEMFIGRASRAIITDKETQVICNMELLTPEQVRHKDEYIADLESKIDKLANNQERTMDEESEFYQYKREYNILLGNSAIFHVGGKTLIERQSRERLIEDAIMACKSAIANGTIYGGNLVIPKIIHDQKLEIAVELATDFPYILVKDKTTFFTKFLNMIENSFLQSYHHVLDNAYFNEREVDNVIKRCIEQGEFYNLKTHNFEPFEETEVINSIDTDIQIMKTCISIIGILGTSNQFITVNYSVSDCMKPVKKYKK